MNFWDNLPKPFFALAPMEDVTDVVFRQVVARAARPDVFFTEFMNVSGFVHPKGRENVARRLAKAPTDAPIVAQIWGSQPEDFTRTAAELTRMEFAGIDINMGCPDKAVVKSGGGSALIASSELAIDIIKAVKNGVRTDAAQTPDTVVPVSVKTRLGYSNVDEWRDWLTILLKQDLDALTIHLRTKKEMSKAPAHHELIPDIVKLRDEIAPKTKLIINGDIANRAAGVTLIEKHPGVDGAMIGRGIFADPFCFEKEPANHSQAELIELLCYHLDLFDKNGSDKYEPLKKFFKIYINNFPGASSLRAELMATKNTAEACKVLDSLTTTVIQ
jgi:tRNA-dihydrouridine synthase